MEFYYGVLLLKAKTSDLHNLRRSYQKSEGQADWIGRQKFRDLVFGTDVSVFGLHCLKIARLLKCKRARDVRPSEMLAFR